MNNFTVISGGSSGVDLQALYAARDNKITTGGGCPKGWLTALPDGGVGSNPELKELGLIETISSDFPTRTKRNIDQSDITLLFGNTESRGSKLAIKTCKQTNRPLIINGSAEDCALAIIAYKANVVNVAGNRQRGNDTVLGDHVYRIVTEIIKILKMRGYIE